MGDEPTLAILGPDGVTCGAVAVTPSLAVTANHCVSEGEVTYVTATHDGRADRTAFGVVVAREVTSDLAVFSGSGFVPATIEQGNVEFEHATTLVTHVPAPWTLAKRHPLDTRDGFVQTERLESGMSGSGLWDDAGRLVGIAVGNDARSGYFAGRGRILSLLRAAPVSVPLKQPVPSAALWGDPNLSIETLIASAKQRREHIEAGLNRLRAGDE
jgi:S1-C subfamily serine protease